MAPRWKALRPGGRRANSAVMFSCDGHLEELKSRRMVIVEPIEPPAKPAP